MPQSKRTPSLLYKRISEHRASLLAVQQSVVTDRASLLAIQQSVVTVRASLLRYTTVCSDGPIIHCTVNSVRNA